MFRRIKEALPSLPPQSPERKSRPVTVEIALKAITHSSRYKPDNVLDNEEYGLAQQLHETIDYKISAEFSKKRKIAEDHNLPRQSFEEVRAVIFQETGLPVFAKFTTLRDVLQNPSLRSIFLKRVEQNILGDEDGVAKAIGAGYQAKDITPEFCREVVDVLYREYGKK